MHDIRECLNYLSASQLLEVKDRDLLLKIVLQLRQGRNQEQCIQELYEQGCLKKLIAGLPESRNKLNIYLNMLTIDYMPGTCTKEAITKNNLFRNLSYLLRKFKHNDDIQREVFRILRNLVSKGPDQQQQIMCCIDIIEREPQFHLISSIITYLKAVTTVSDDPCEPGPARPEGADITIIMAIDVLTELTGLELLVPLIKDCEILSTLGMVVRQFTPLWQKTTNHGRILWRAVNLIMKLVELSAKKNMFNVMLELQKTPKGDSLTYLGHLLPLRPKAVVKITTILSELNRQTRGFPVMDIFKGLIEKLENPSSFMNGREDFMHEEYVNCLWLMIECGNVYKERNFTVSLIPMFLQILQDYTKPSDRAITTCTTIIIKLMNECSFSILLDHGFMKILSEKLNLILDYDNSININYKLQISNPIYSKPHKRLKLTLDRREDSNCDSDASTSSYKSCCDSSSDRDSTNSCDFKNLPNLTPDVCVSVYLSFRIKERFCNAIVDIVEKAMCNSSGVIQIISSGMLTKLLKFLDPKCKLVYTNSILKVIQHVLSGWNFYDEIMQTDFISTAWELKIRLSGASSSTLHEIQEYILDPFKRYVSFEQIHLQEYLDQASLSVKQKIVSIIPHITESLNDLRHLMLTCHGLNVMLDSLKSNENLNTQRRCITGLFSLSNRLYTEKPCDFEVGFDLCQEFPVVNKDKDYEITVCFKMDDGTSFEENRDFLSTKSEYFNNLLCGKFKESSQYEIPLHNVSSELFKLLLLFLRSHFSPNRVNSLRSVVLDVLLDVIGLAHQYVLEDLCLYLTRCVLQFKMKPENVHLIYQWSLQSQTNILRKESVIFAVTAVNDDIRRFNMYQNFLQLKCSELFVKDLENFFFWMFKPKPRPELSL